MRLLRKAPLRRGFLVLGLGGRRLTEGHEGLQGARLAHGADRSGAPEAAETDRGTWEHLFPTSQGSAYARFRRALDSRNATVAFATAAELVFASRPDALELLLSTTHGGPGARLFLHAANCGGVSDLGLQEAR